MSSIIYHRLLAVKCMHDGFLRVHIRPCALDLDYYLITICGYLSAKTILLQSVSAEYSTHSKYSALINVAFLGICVSLVHYCNYAAVNVWLYLLGRLPLNPEPQAEGLVTR